MAVYSDVLPTTDLKYEDIRDTLNANRIISPELLQDCKVWATLTTGDNQTYIGNTYTHN